MSAPAQGPSILQSTAALFHLHAFLFADGIALLANSAAINRTRALSYVLRDARGHLLFSDLANGGSPLIDCVSSTRHAMLAQHAVSQGDGFFALCHARHQRRVGIRL